MKNKLWIVFVLIMMGPLLWADQFVVRDIKIEGLLRASPAIIYAAMPIQKGDRINDDDIIDATHAIFETGDFDDIKLLRKGSTLIVSVKERPIVRSVSVEGNKLIKTDALLQGMSKNGLVKNEIFKRSTLELIKLSLKRQYVAQGRNDANVEVEVENLTNNQVAIYVIIDEGHSASIKQINITGNETFSDEELLDFFSLKTEAWYRFFSSSDKYAKEKLRGDLEKLESFYHDQGYLRFEIESVQVSLSPSKRDVYITINVNEGAIYKVGKVNIIGSETVSFDLIRIFILPRTGETFSQGKIIATEQLLKNNLGNYSYAKAMVSSRTHEKPNNIVDIDFMVDPGRQYYVRQINFVGNKKTHDAVLRRELRQMESAAIKTGLINQSKLRLQRLPYLKVLRQKLLLLMALLIYWI